MNFFGSDVPYTCMNLISIRSLDVEENKNIRMYNYVIIYQAWTQINTNGY